MFAVTTTPTSLSSSATRSLKNNKASSLSKRAKCSSIVVSSSSSSSSSKSDEKFDRREMLKNALVASVGVVAATPMPVRSFVRLVLPIISRVFMHFVVFRLDHQKAEKKTTRKRVCGFDLSTRLFFLSFPRRVLNLSLSLSLCFKTQRHRKSER